MQDILEKALKKLKEGDDKELGTIYDIMGRGVFTFVLPIIKDYQLTEDITQETFIKVYHYASSYQPGTNPRNWILTIAKNLAFNYLEKRKHEVVIDYNDASMDYGCYHLNLELDTPLIKLANKILKEDELQIIMLYVVGEYKHREIAEMLNIPLGTVTWKYQKALTALKEAYLKGGYQND